MTDRIDVVPFTDGAGEGWAAWRPRVLGLFDVLGACTSPGWCTAI